MALKINSYSRRDRKAAGGAGRQIWKRLDAVELADALGVLTFDCHACGCYCEDEVVSRWSIEDGAGQDEGAELFCSIACGALFEREAFHESTVELRAKRTAKRFAQYAGKARAKLAAEQAAPINRPYVRDIFAFEGVVR